MTPLEDSFQDILLPENFINNFTDEEHFKEWCRGGIINDLKEMLKVFEEHEMYEYARHIQDVIDEKVNKMLDGLGFTD